MQFSKSISESTAHPQPRGAKFACSDERLNKLFAAGVLTFRENCVDLFMDCPSRERAGWLCDSFFTARVAADLTGMPLVEHNFVENFLLPEKFAHLPEGMLPMCYPADHNDGVFIPNWAMWFVVQLEEYLARSGDRATVEALRPRVQKLLAYLGRFENSDGLLEKLPSWVFVEWSAANQFVQDVNYPTNMLYAGALSAAGRIYGQPEMASKAEKIRRTIRRQSFDGQFFVDNALRRGGKLQATRNRSEVCQYFAFFFGVADHKTHAALWNSLRDEFGPQRAKTKAHAEVHPANSFIGNMLRMELSLRPAAASRSSTSRSPTCSIWPIAPARSGKTWGRRQAATTASRRTSSTRSTATCWACTASIRGPRRSMCVLPTSGSIGAKVRYSPPTARLSSAGTNKTAGSPTG